MRIALICGACLLAMTNIIGDESAQSRIFVSVALNNGDIEYRYSDRVVSWEKLSDIGSFHAKIGGNQSILLFVDGDVPSSIMLKVHLLLRSSGFHNVHLSTFAIFGQKGAPIKLTFIGI